MFCQWFPFFVNGSSLAITDLDDPPSRHLAYSLTKTLIRISIIEPTLEKQAQSIFLDHLEKVGGAFSGAIVHQGLSDPAQS